MKITPEMLKKAHAVVPSLTIATVKAMLEAATAGQVFFAEGVGETIVAGKSTYPTYLQIEITDPMRALELGEQLVRGARLGLYNKAESRPITLMMAGEVDLSD